MKGLILALTLVGMSNSVFAADFYFCDPVNEGDRPRQIRDKDQIVGGGQGCSGKSEVVEGDLDPRSEHEYDYMYKNGKVVYVPQLGPGPHKKHKR